MQLYIKYTHYGVEMWSIENVVSWKITYSNEKRISNSITKNNVSNNNIIVPYDLKLANIYDYFEHSNTFTCHNEWTMSIYPQILIRSI